MKIGIIADALDHQYAGIYQVVKQMVGLLPEVNTENEYFVFCNDATHVSPKAIHIQVSKGIGVWRRSHRIFFQIPRKAKELGLDVMIEPAHFGPFFLPPHIKRVTYIHDLSAILYPEWHPWMSSLLQRLCLKRIAQRADLILTNSHFTKSEIVKHLDVRKENVGVTHLGVDQDFSPKYDPYVIAKYGLHKAYFFYLGTIEPRKNLINLIKGYELFRKSYPDFDIQLVLGGKKGWKSKEVIKAKYFSEHRDDIILLGYCDRDDIPYLYSHAEVAVYPSHYEGFGLPILEALACGTKLVCANTSSLREVGGEYAIYFDPNKIYQIDSSLQSVHIKKEVDTEQVRYAQGYTWCRTMEGISNSLRELY